VSGARIAVVEDDPMSQRLMLDLLTATGYDVAVYGDAESGLAAMLAAPPALVLMDIRLPGMDGFAALVALRADAAMRDVPVIAVTASVMLGEREKIMDAGFTGYHPKPIQIPLLLKEIEQTLADSSKSGA
jgi:two-component system, cell cycle response regulator DivK